MYHPIKFKRPNECMNCNKLGIELFDKFNNPLDYADLINKHNNGLPVPLDGRPIYKMKCIKCGQLYNIIWRNGFPYPDNNTIQRIEHFTNLFKGDNI